MVSSMTLVSAVLSMIMLLIGSAIPELMSEVKTPDASRVRQREPCVAAEVPHDYDVETSGNRLHKRVDALDHLDDNLVED